MRLLKRRRRPSAPPLPAEARYVLADIDGRIAVNKAIVEDAVATGPDCLCGHPRSEHCGTKALAGSAKRPMTFFDGPCQVDGCSCTPIGYMQPGGYVPPPERF